jgi:GNAT superfamily N-acetyltransferase
MAAEPLIHTATLRDGTQVWVRPICKDDVSRERVFIEGLSPQSRRFRFLGTFRTPSDALLQRLTNPDTASEAAFIALNSPAADASEIGAARFCIQPHGDGAEVAVIVDDHWQGKGLATILLQHLIQAARERGVRRLYSVDAGNNQAMRDFAAHLGFARSVDPDDATQVIYSLNI